MRLWYLFILLMPFAFSLEISEIMYNPADGNEWIEFYTEDDLDFSGFELSDNLNTDQIVCCKTCNFTVRKQSYFLVLDKDTSMNLSGVHFCVDDNSIGNGLGNNMDNIIIRKGNRTYANHTYTNATKKGNSISKINNTWIETIPTPWEKNEFLVDNFNSSQNVSLCSNCSRNISAPKIEPCNISIALETDKTLYHKGEQAKIRHMLTRSQMPFMIDYWIEDLFGTVVKDHQLTSNTNQKSFTPDFSELEKSYIIYSNLTTICNNSGITFASRIITFKGNNSKIDPEITITKIPSKLKFGDIFEVEIKIKKGNIRKSAIKVYVEKDNVESEITSMNILSKNEEVILSIPIKLKEHCGVSGTYYLVVEGLDMIKREEVDISELACKSSSSQSAKSSGTSSTYSTGYVSTKKDEYELLDYSREFEKDVKSIIRIANQDTMNHTYRVWSYIYSGSTSLSGDREKNLVEIALKPKEKKDVELFNALEKDAKEQNMLKIKILREDRKTEHEFTQELIYAGSPKSIGQEGRVDEPTITIKNNTDDKENLTRIASQITGKVVFQEEDQTNYLPYLLIPIAFILGYLLYNKLV